MSNVSPPMNLPNTLTKLEDARTMHAELMRASDPVKFRAAFGAFPLRQERSPLGMTHPPGGPTMTDETVL